MITNTISYKALTDEIILCATKFSLKELDSLSVLKH